MTHEQNTGSRRELFVDDFMIQRWRRSEAAILRPGIAGDSNWVYGDCHFAIGMIDMPRRGLIRCVLRQAVTAVETSRLPVSGLLARSASGACPSASVSSSTSMSVYAPFTAGGPHRDTT